MIIQTVNADTFIRAFDEMNRGGNFSTEARYALFDFYDEMSDDCGIPFELDVIAICCDWSELSVGDCISGYSHLIDQDDLVECNDDDEEKLDYLETLLVEQTTVIRLDETLLIQAF